VICIFCGQNISQLKQRPVPVARLEFRPYIGQSEPGQDNLSGMECCQDCYHKVLFHRAESIAEYGKLKDIKE